MTQINKTIQLQYHEVWNVLKLQKILEIISSKIFKYHRIQIETIIRQNYKCHKKIIIR